MVWSIEFDPGAFAELERLDPPIQKRILRYLRERIATAEVPHRYAPRLGGEEVGPWRYRVGGYRNVVGNCFLLMRENLVWTRFFVTFRHPLSSPCTLSLTTRREPSLIPASFPI